MSKGVNPSKNSPAIPAVQQTADAPLRPADDAARVSDPRLVIDAGNLEEIVQGRWLAALRRDAPNLPTPIALAMTQGVARGPLGKTLHEIEQALMDIENMNWGDLTGSEVRLLAAILRQMNETLGQLSATLGRLYAPSEE